MSMSILFTKIFTVLRATVSLTLSLNCAQEQKITLNLEDEQNKWNGIDEKTIKAY